MRIGGDKPGIQILDNSLRAYNFLFNGTLDRVSKTTLPAANYTGAHYNLVNGQLVTYGANEYVRDGQGRILTFGAYTQLCLNSEDPSAAGWTTDGTTTPTITSDTASNSGPFLAHRVKSGGSLSSRYNFWRSTALPASGAPVGVQYVRVYYISGDSGSIFVSFRNATTAQESYYSGTIGSASVGAQVAGSLTLISDTYDSSLGYRTAVLKVNFNTKGDSLTIGVGPFSATVDKYITILGADVLGGSGSGDISTWRPHVPSSGSVVSVSATKYDYNGGTPRGPRLALASMPDAIIGLQGTGPGDASGQIEWAGTPLFSAADIAADQNIVVCNETASLLNFDTTGFEVKDGTNTSTATVAFVKDTGYIVKVPYGPHPVTKEMKIVVDEESSELGSNDGSFNPDAYVGFGGSDFPVAHTSFKIRKTPAW